MNTEPLDQNEPDKLDELDEIGELDESDELDDENERDPLDEYIACATWFDEFDEPDFESYLDDAVIEFDSEFESDVLKLEGDSNG